MKRILTILLIVLGLALLSFGIYYFFDEGPSTGDGTPIDQNPFGTGGQDVTPGVQTLPITLKGGGVAHVPDFTKDNQPAIAGPDTGYQVAGNAEATYHILYFPEDSYFLVSLFAEPLRLTREDAEEELRTKLKLTEPQLCALNIQVFTDFETSEFYAGKELGLSFCQGATYLP
jgi:hypothetical protein